MHILAIFLFALIAREAVTFLVAELDKTFEYQLIAANLVNGLGMSWNEWGRLPLQPTALFPPLYIYWCAFFIWIFGQSNLVMFVVQAVVSASGCLPAYLVGRRMFSPRIGTLFAVAYAVYPEMMYVHSRATPEFLYVVICLWVLHLYLLLADNDVVSRDFVKHAWILGFLTGAGLLVREGVLIVSGAAGLSLIMKKRPVGLVIKNLVLPVALATMLVLAPWTIRNWIVQGRFIPLRSAYGLNLWMGNHEEATGTDKTMDGRYQMGLLWEKNREYYARTIPNDEYDRNQFYRNEALEYIRTHPRHYMMLTAKRLWYFVWFDPTHPLAKNRIYRASYMLLLILAIPGIVQAARARKLDAALVIAFAGFLLLYVPVIILPRYRIVPMMFLLLMASVAVDWIIQRYLAGQRRRT
jgi:4-amino-4-deoxy-L-arabinose transferase-like glycosyltransferase